MHDSFKITFFVIVAIFMRRDTLCLSFTEDLHYAIDSLHNQSFKFFVWMEYIETEHRFGDFDVAQHLLLSSKFREALGSYKALNDVIVYLTKKNLRCSKKDLDKALILHSISETFIRRIYRSYYDYFYSAIIIDNCDLSCSIASHFTDLLLDSRLYVSYCTNWKPLYRYVKPMPKKDPNRIRHPNYENTFKPIILKLIKMIYDLIKFLNFGCVQIVLNPESAGDSIAKFYISKLQTWLNPCIILETFDSLDEKISKHLNVNDSYRRGPNLIFFLMSHHNALDYLEVYGNKQYFRKKIPIIFSASYRPMDQENSGNQVIRKIKRAIFVTMRDVLNANADRAKRSSNEPTFPNKTLTVYRPLKAMVAVKEELRACINNIALHYESYKNSMNYSHIIPNFAIPKYNSSVEVHFLIKPKHKRFKAKFILFTRYWIYEDKVDDRTYLNKMRVLKMWNEYGRGSKDRCGFRGEKCKKHRYGTIQIFQIVIYFIVAIILIILSYILYVVNKYRRLLKGIGKWNVNYKESDHSDSSGKSTRATSVFSAISSKWFKARDNVSRNAYYDYDDSLTISYVSKIDIKSNAEVDDDEDGAIKSFRSVQKMEDEEDLSLQTLNSLMFRNEQTWIDVIENMEIFDELPKLNTSWQSNVATNFNQNCKTKKLHKAIKTYQGDNSNKNSLKKGAKHSFYEESSYIKFKPVNFIKRQISVKKIKEKIAFFQADEIYLHKFKHSKIWLHAFNVKFLEDIAILKNLNHENLLPFIGICSKKSSVLMLAAKRGSLRDIIKDKCLNQIFNLGLVVSLLIDIAKGMDYLHNSDIGSHGHLRSTKCVVDSRWHCKITGYGLSEIRRNVSKNVKPKISSMLYAAPELLRTPIHYRSHYGTRKGDIFSFAIITQETILMDKPYALDVKQDKIKMVEILAKVRSKKLNPPFRPKLGNKCPKEWKMLVNNCWAEEPEKRFNFQQILTILRKLAGTDNLTFVERLSQKLEQNASNLGRMVTDLTAHLEAESEKASNLLGCLLPKVVAEDYILGKPYQPKIFKCITILCTDIMGFTKISARSTARETVEFLNALYSSYDAIVKTRDAYKLETIGDAYIVISGCPEKNGDLHASEIAIVALELFTVLKTHKIQHLPNEEIKSRAGIHSGPIIAGVVGLKVPRFCVFGTAYNVAEVMESTSLANMIRISKDSVNLLPPNKFKLSQMEQIVLPDKSSIETYFLLGKY